MSLLLSRLSFWWTGEGSISLGRNRPRIVLHLALFLAGAAVWIWTEVEGHGGEGYASDYHAQYLLGLTALATGVTVVPCRLADVLTPRRFDLLRLRLEFTLMAFLSFVWFSLTTALTSYTLHLWPSTPIPSASNPPHWPSPPLGRSFVTTTLFLTAFFQTATFAGACGVLSMAVAQLRGEGRAGGEEGGRWVMWDLGAGTEDVEDLGVEERPARRGYGAVDEGGRVGSPMDAPSPRPPQGTGVKEGKEGKEGREMRSYFWVLGTLALGGVIGSAGWMLFGYETDVADISLIVLNALTLWFSACYLFLPSRFLPTPPKHLSIITTHLLPLLPLVVYPIPTILFTLPPIPSAPPASESHPSDSPSLPLSVFDTAITYTPGLAVGCGWAIQVFVVLWAARTWMPAKVAGPGGVGDGGGERGDLFFPAPAHAPTPPRPEEEALLGNGSSPRSPTTTRFGRWGVGRRTDEGERERMREFEIEEREVLLGEEDGEEVVRLMSPAPVGRR